jgi:hypothetical protein
MNRRPIRLTMKAMTPLAPAIGVERRLQGAVGHVGWQRPNQPGALETLQRLPNGRGRDAEPPRDLAGRNTS